MSDVQEKMVFYPKVSIIIPVYNGADYVAEAIEGALSQTYKNTEVIVINDGSNDEGKTREAVKKYIDRIQYYEKPNGGVSSALNFGITKMTGEYFSWLSHDDNYSSNKIEDAVQIMSQNVGENVIAYTEGFYIDKNSKPIKQFRNHFTAGKTYDGLSVIKHMLKRGTLNGCCMLIPRKAFELCGTFDERLRYNQDALMWYKIFGSGYKLISDNNLNVMYRLHEKQTSNICQDLLLNDSYLVSKDISPFFADKSNKKFNLLFHYTLRNALYCCTDAVEESIRVGKMTGCLSSLNLFMIKLILKYGLLRKKVKNIYYRSILKIKR